MIEIICDHCVSSMYIHTGKNFGGATRVFTIQYVYTHANTSIHFDIAHI